MVIKDLSIEGFRRFAKLQLRDLGQVNLLVGENNCGKTSILEAIFLLLSEGDTWALWQTLFRRGEEFFDDDGLNSHSRKIDVCRLFHGHELKIGVPFRIEAGPKLSFVGELVETLTQFGRKGELALTWNRGNVNPIQLTRSGGIPFELIRNSFVQPRSGIHPQFITGSGAAPDIVVEMFDEIVLTREEELVLQALRIIEPSIERIASTAADWQSAQPDSSGLRGGILVRCSDSNARIPIGSFGEGIWRMLGLALALVRAKNGILLVDDIDTGLHYSVMENMWRLVSETAKRLNVQVFATTHSRDCYEALAAVCGERDAEHSEITIQRIERDRQVSVAYSEQEIIAAARHAIEVR